MSVVLLVIFSPIGLYAAFRLYANTPKTSPWYLPVMGIGAVIDLVVNVTWMSVVFLEFPKELLLTKRVERLKSDLGYRGKLATAICKMLNHYMEGHCQ